MGRLTPCLFSCLCCRTFRYCRILLVPSTRLSSTVASLRSLPFHITPPAACAPLPRPAGVLSLAGCLPLPALRLLHAFVCYQLHRSFTQLADMGDELAVGAAKVFF